eukprot:CAMPEP_0168393906 /NCGR_PEP_ID=MMETSP0228-20121227/19257_1 /TAXON_ID=133427 /ORGANISM="Protoceratium reticulatum, Strain CCCM 535 (=CCMP 1889)" /LENGTH=661 /DNA_ID=CAMNT_0008407297 /DNA_START=64 /DNA_END=2049 /DNA_ORIENTATION=-
MTSKESTGDPYRSMWNSADFNHARIFDQDLLRSIYEKPHQKVRHQASLFGSGILGLLAMPFGPIGMVAGAVIGGLMGAAVGLCADKRIKRNKMQEWEIEKKRIRCLMRWASERLSEDDEVMKLIEMVTLEFKPVADVADHSKSARKLLKLLDQWIARKSVSRYLWVYMDQLLQRWRTLSQSELLRSMRVFQTLTTMYRCSPRVLDETEVRFQRRMERLLAHESVKSVLAHAQLQVTEGESRVMESMVYADAIVSARSVPRSPLNRSPGSRGCKSPPGERAGYCGQISSVSEDPEEGENSEDSEPGDNFETYNLTATPSGMRSPAAAPRTSTPRAAAEPAAAKTPGGGGRRELVLKKPFFRNWQDFMDFDDTIKHRMAITLSEFDLLCQKEQEDTKGWDVCVERRELRVAKVIIGTGTICIRAWATFPGVDLHTAFYLFYNLDERTKWDKTFCKMQVVDTNIDGSDIVYCLMKIPTVTSRDFLQYRRVRVLEDGSICIVMRSSEHPDVPEDKNYIRVENKISGYVLRQEYDNGKPVLKMFLMTCSDVKGMIPKWIINYLAPKKPGEWMDALRKAAVEFQETNPGRKEELMRHLQKFSTNTPFDYELESTAEHTSISRGSSERRLFGADAADRAGSTAESGCRAQGSSSERPSAGLGAPGPAA